MSIKEKIIDLFTLLLFILALIAMIIGCFISS